MHTTKKGAQWGALFALAERDSNLEPRSGERSPAKRNRCATLSSPSKSEPTARSARGREASEWRQLGFCRPSSMGRGRAKALVATVQAMPLAALCENLSHKAEPLRDLFIIIQVIATRTSSTTQKEPPFFVHNSQNCKRNLSKIYKFVLTFKIINDIINYVWSVFMPICNFKRKGVHICFLVQ